MSLKTVFQRRACPDDGMIANYLDALLSQKERRRVEHHVRTCRACPLLIKALRALWAHRRVEALSPVPGELTEWTRQFVRAAARRRPLLDIVATFADRAVHALQTTGTVLRGPAAQPAYVLRRAAAPRSGTLIVQQRLGSVTVQVQIAGMDRGVHAISLHATSPRSRSSVDQMRATLVQGELSLESHPFRRGSVRFEGVRQGRYVIQLDSPAKMVGVVFLHLLGS